MENGTLFGIFISQERHAPMLALPQTDIIENYGLSGDRKAQHDSKRQVLLVDEATLQHAAVPAGGLNENLAVRGIDVNALRAGQQVCIGDVVLEVTMPCTVCGELDQIRPGLKDALRGRRGMLARVLRGGTVRVGDAINVQG